MGRSARGYGASARRPVAEPSPEDNSSQQGKSQLKLTAVAGIRARQPVRWAPPLATGEVATGIWKSLADEGKNR
jgi:hypothetical protein